MPRDASPKSASNSPPHLLPRAQPEQVRQRMQHQVHLHLRNRRQGGGALLPLHGTNQPSLFL